MSDVAGRRTGRVAMAVVVLAWLARPWSCIYVISQFSRADPVPYAGFDAHGYGATLAMLVTLVFGAPVLWLASRVVLDRRARFGVFGRGRSVTTTVVSVLVALAIGAPLEPQLAALIDLPFHLSVVVLATSLVWLLVVEVVRTAVVEGDLLGRGAKRLAIAVAVLVVALQYGSQLWLG